MNHAMNRRLFEIQHSVIIFKRKQITTKFQISVFLNRENSSEVFFIIRRVHKLNSCKNPTYMDKSKCY